jgi:outer membrane protein assembly factor BamB
MAKHAKRQTGSKRAAFALSLTPADNPIPRGTFGDIGAFFRVRSRRSFSNALLEIPYSRAKARHVDEQTLRLFRWEHASRSLVLINPSGVDVERRRVWGRVNEGGLYGAIGLPLNQDLRRTIGIFALFSADELRASPRLIPPICGLILCAQNPGGGPDPPGSLCDLCLGIQVPRRHLPEVQILQINPGRVFVGPPLPPQPPIWACPRHDYRNTSQSSQNGPAAQPTLSWSFAFGANSVLSTPVVAADGTVYIGAWVGNIAIGTLSLYAIAGDSGLVKWSARIADAYYFPQPAIGPDGTVYLSYWSRPSLKWRLHAFDRFGSTKWTFDSNRGLSNRGLDFPMPSSDGSVYVLAGRAEILKLDDRGIEAWATPLALGGSLPTPYYPRRPETVVAVRDDGSLIVKRPSAFPTATSSVVAVAPSGQVLWTFNAPDIDIFAPPVVSDDGRVILLTAGGVLSVLDSAGSLVPGFPSAYSSWNTASVARTGNIYLAGNGGPLAAFDRTGKMIWGRLLGDIWGPAIANDGTLYVTVPVFRGGLDVYAIDPTNGIDKWISRVAAPGTSGDPYNFLPPVIGAGGTLLVVDPSATLHALV